MGVEKCHVASPAQSPTHNISRSSEHFHGLWSLWASWNYPKTEWVYRNLTMSAILSCMGPGTLLNEKIFKWRGWGVGDGPKKNMYFQNEVCARWESFFKGLCMYNIISLFTTFLVKDQCSLVYPVRTEIVRTEISTLWSRISTKFLIACWLYCEVFPVSTATKLHP